MRVWSQELVPGDPGTVIERGAEFVLNGYAQLTGWVARLGPELANKTNGYYVRESRGGEPVTVDEVVIAAEVLARAAAAAPSSVSVAAILTRIAISWASEVTELSCRALQGPASVFAPNPTYRVAGGNQGIAHAMAVRLGDRVRLGCPVRRLAHDEGSATAWTDEGAERADVVIITVPLACSSALPVEPALPAWKNEAWLRTGLGQAARLHVMLAEPAPASAVLSVPDGFWTWVATGASGSPQPIAHCFAGSTPVLDRLGARSGPGGWLARLAGLRPELSFDADRALLTTWADDPWAGVAYSAERSVSQEDDPALMAAPVDRLHFAGEHTAGPWAGLMEGALRSGERVAQEVLMALGRPRPRGR